MSMFMVCASILGLVPLFGCTLGLEGEDPSQGSPPAPLLVLGQGGGFTGAVGGFRLFPDGTLFRWERFPGKPERTQPCGKITSQQLAQLRQMLASVDWNAVPQGEPGNVTSFLEITLPSESREIHWAGLYDDAPPPLRPILSLALPWFERCEGQR